MAGLYQAAAGIGRLEQLAAGSSPVHRLHPGAKLAATVVFLAAVISLPRTEVSGLVPFVFYPVIIMSLSGTPYRPLFGRLAAALPFALTGGISNLFFMRETAYHIGGLAVSFGMLSFASVMLKTFFCVLAVLILIATTPFNAIAAQLKKLHIPDIICLQLVMIYRYLSILIGEAFSMHTAYSLRAPRQKGIKMGDMGSFLGQLILRSFDRAERVWQAMSCRGFCGVFYTGEEKRFGARDLGFVAATTAAALLLRFFNLSLFLAGNL